MAERRMWRRERGVQGNGATGEETLDQALLDRARGAEAHQAVRVSIVIPALNEATNLPHVLPRLDGLAHEVVLTDGNSDDGTCEVARSLRPDIVAQGTAAEKGMRYPPDSPLRRATSS